jgi:hypothetical protein
MYVFMYVILCSRPYDYVCMHVYVLRYDVWHYFQRNGRNISIPLVEMNITVGKEVPCANINSEKPFDQWFLRRYYTLCTVWILYTHMQTYVCMYVSMYVRIVVFMGLYHSMNIFNGYAYKYSYMRAVYTYIHTVTYFQ